MSRLGYRHRIPPHYDRQTFAEILGDIETSLNPTTRHGWADLLCDLSAGRGVGANAPTWAAFQDGIYGYRFSASAMNELWFNVHIPHDYAFRIGTGTNDLYDGKVYPHVHWSQGSGTNTGTVRWGLEYSIAKGYSQEAFPASSTIYIEQAATGTSYQHQIAEPAEGSGIYSASFEPDALMLCRLFRDGAHGNDTCTDTVWAFFADLHYVSDRYNTIGRNVGSGWVKKI